MWEFWAERCHLRTGTDYSAGSVNWNGATTMTDRTVETMAWDQMQRTAEKVAGDLEYAAARVRQIVAAGPSARLDRPYAYIAGELDSTLRSAWMNFPMESIRQSSFDAEIDRASRKWSSSGPSE